MLKMFECASGLVPFSTWVRAAESFSNRKTEKLDFYLKPAYSILEDILVVAHGVERPRNVDVDRAVRAIATRVPFEWIERAVKAIDELALMTRRNIQKIIALDAVIMDLRNQLRVGCA
jgi:DNA polymerase-3 subunit delta'